VSMGGKGWWGNGVRVMVHGQREKTKIGGRMSNFHLPTINQAVDGIPDAHTKISKARLIIPKERFY